MAGHWHGFGAHHHEPPQVALSSIPWSQTTPHHNNTDAPMLHPFSSSPQCAAHPSSGPDHSLVVPGCLEALSDGHTFIPYSVI